MGLYAVHQKGVIMLNMIPVFGWIASFVVNVSLAVPFWLAWTVGETGRTFFPFLPAQYQSPGFWECVGLFLCFSILKLVLTPKLAVISQENNNHERGR